MALRTLKRSASRWPWSRRLRRTMLTALVAVGLAVAVGACTSSSATSSAPTASASGKVGGSLTVWVNAVRLPVAQAYAKAHPNVHVHIVTFDGDGNGATSLQAKIQLWNRTGSGWPDVIFSEQVNDPVWMAQKPFDFAAPVTGLIPQSTLSQWPSPSTTQCTINGTQYCLQDNLAQVVLWYNKKLMTQFGYTGPDDMAAVGGARPEGRHPAPGLRHRDQRGVVQPLDLLLGQPVPAREAARQPAADQHLRCALHRDGQPARPADQERDACRR